MEVVHAVAPLRARIQAWRQAGDRVALVPTMGNLHEGHLSLVEEARRQAERVVVSVFVNPLQFGPGEDFDRYPRTLAADTEALMRAPCDLLYAPLLSEMYPRGAAPVTQISVPDISETLEGAFRPGHFDGVATVVSLLLHQVLPDVACFGQKDYQQLAVIRRMVSDQQMPVAIVGVPTCRADDGLALSSRNQYLSADERRRAPRIKATLDAVAAALRSGRRDYAALERDATAALSAAGFQPQYVAVRTPTLETPDAHANAWVVLVAAFLGSTRLIDNLEVQDDDGADR